MTLIITIPDWNDHEVLPPIATGAAGNTRNRSPYRVGLSEFVDHFSSSNERIEILDEFLRFREELHNVGLTSGFQWVDGSFLENIEVIENRFPEDVDVVTFYTIPQTTNQQSLFNHIQIRSMIDAYWVQVDHPDHVENVRLVAYWYSMWSHRRNGLWKGFLQIDLDSTSDDEARSILDAKKEMFR